MFRNEWLYTKANKWSVLSSLITPLVLMVPGILTTAVGPGAVALQPLLIYFALYLAVSMTTVNRSVDRVRHEGEERSGLLYLRTKATWDRIIAVKLLFESIINLVAVALPLSLLFWARAGASWGEILHIGAAVVALTALTFVASCLITTGGAYHYFTLAIVLPPLLLAPGSGINAESPMASFVLLVPTMSAFTGFSEIASGLPVNPSLAWILVLEAIALIAYSGRAYRRFLRYRLVSR